MLQLSVELGSYSLQKRDKHGLRAVASCFCQLLQVWLACSQLLINPLFDTLVWDLLCRVLK